MAKDTDQPAAGGDANGDASRRKREDLKRSARKRRWQERRKRAERPDWGRMWREGKLPKLDADDSDVVYSEGMVADSPVTEDPFESSGETIDAAEPRMALRVGMVLGLYRGGCRILADGEELDGVLRQHLLAQQKSVIAPGDRVEFHMSRNHAVVENVLERTTMLCRPDPMNPNIGRAIAANIELVVIVASVVEPALSPTLIDRYLIGAERGEVEPLIVVNKLDLIDHAWPEVMAPYADLGVAALGCSAVDGYNMDTLGAAIAGKLCVFVGHSGTGKSSLLNTLQPDLKLKTRAVHGPSGQGRHTTVTAALYELDNGAQVIDTPGIREFGFWQMKPEELRWYFPEFDDAPPCKFNDCSHTHEPRCGVKQAVDAGAIPPARYESYLRIFESLGGEGAG